MHLSHQPDTKPHSSIQTWSRGDIFPAVIKRVEYYDNQHASAAARLGEHYPLSHRQLWGSTRWTLILNGVETDHSTYDAAYRFAEDALQRAEREVKTDAAISALEAARQRAFERDTQIGKQAAQADAVVPAIERLVDTEGRLMQSGALYAERYTDHYGEGEHRYGRLMWYGGVGRQFFDADTHDAVTPEGDSLVRQRVTVNVLYVA